MRLYSFQGRYGHDKICRSEQKDLSVGDLLTGKADMFLVLGEQVARKADKAKFNISEQLEINHSGFFGKKAIELIHRMVHEYYTSYKNVVKLFVTGELADLFKKEVGTKKKSAFIPVNITHAQISIGELESKGQQLIIFPDVRTMTNMMKGADMDTKGIAALNSTSTQQQKDKAWRGIKMGHINTLLCTYSQIFQDRKDLTSITLIDSHQRYYKSQQDPRYDAREVVKKMADLYKAELNLQGIHVFTDQPSV